MKCSYCGAEIGNDSVCKFCDSQIPPDLQAENKKGCPNCGSSNIQFRRENQGELRKKNSKKVIYKTVGFCKDCGHTWYPNYQKNTVAKNDYDKLILWIFGWLIFFPIPVMILIWRKKNTWSKKTKITVTVIFWIFFLILSLGRNKQDDTSITDNINTNEETSAVTVANEENSVVEQETEIISLETNESAATEEDILTIELQAGMSNEYSREIVLNAGTEFELKYLGYFVPAGLYTVKNLGEYSDQVNIYTNEIHITEEGWEEPAGNMTNILLNKGESKEITVNENQYIKIVDPSHIELRLHK